MQNEKYDLASAIADAACAIIAIVIFIALLGGL